MSLQQTITLRSGEAITTAEVFEAMALLAQTSSPFPILAQEDQTLAFMALGLQAQAWARSEELL